MPIIGRLMTTSMRLPIHMLAMRPQNSSGCCVITCGPGAMPWIIMAPIISAITGVDGMPSVSSGTIAPPTEELFAASGAATPSIAPWPNRSGVLERRLLEGVGHEGRNRRPGTRQHAEDGADERAAYGRGSRPPELLTRRP